ncbi:MAG TPA: hypothetical protein VEY67_11985 [Candidatus Dormibacteraeota bacterium]|nr:hypothetical protein [Candidatus Dormibacteraeota bacterium]
MHARPPLPRLAAALALALAIAGCAGGSSSPTASPDAGSVASSSSPSAPPSSAPRPASTAKLAIVSPAQNAVVTGGTVHVVISLTGATIVTQTSTDIRPDQGHIHLYVDNNLVSMNYGTTQDLQAVPGAHVLRAEFVASDHAPFDPRDVTPDVVFTVKP